MLLGSLLMGCMYFYVYLVSSFGPVDFTKFSVWVGFLIGASMFPFASLALFIFGSPIKIQISDESFSYNLCLREKSKTIFWKDVLKYKKTLTGVKFVKADGEKTFKLYLFPKDDRKEILEQIKNKISME